MATKAPTPAPEEQAPEQEAQTQAAAPEEAAPVMQRHEYPDGSFRIGCAPFPELSPIQEDAAQKRAHAEAHGHFAAQG